MIYGSDEEKRANAQQEIEIKLARAFQAVFGTEENRTEEQKFVMETIKVWSFYDRPFSSVGPMPPESWFKKEGMRELFLCIKQQCDHNFESTKQEAPKVDTSSRVGK